MERDGRINVVVSLTLTYLDCRGQIVIVCIMVRGDI